MTPEDLKNLADKIIDAKAAGLRLKEQIELEKNVGLGVDLERQRKITGIKRIKSQIEDVNLGIVSDELRVIGAKRQLIQQKSAIELEGMASELPELRQSIQLRIQAMRDKNLKTMLGD